MTSMRRTPLRPCEIHTIAMKGYERRDFRIRRLLQTRARGRDEELSQRGEEDAGRSGGSVRSAPAQVTHTAEADSACVRACLPACLGLPAVTV